MKILVTGGAGYIGSTLVPMLLEQNYDVTVLDNLLYNQTSLLECCYKKNFHFIKGDVRNHSLLSEEVNKADCIIALSALVGAPLCDKDPDTSTAVNELAIKKIVDLKSKDQMLIYPCTNSGYGIGQEGILCTEETALNPVSLYGKQKVEAEKYVVEKGCGISFRLATVFGLSPRMRLDLLVNDFTYRAVYDGFIVLFEPHFKRNYLHVRDASRAFLHAIQNYSTMNGQSYNVGLSSANISKHELCEEIQKLIPRFTYLISEIGNDPDKRNYIVSNEKIELTGFKTQFSLPEGLAELVKGFKILKRNQFANI